MKRRREKREAYPTWPGTCFVIHVFGRDVTVHVRGACSCYPRPCECKGPMHECAGYYARTVADPYLGVPTKDNPFGCACKSLGKRRHDCPGYYESLG